MGFIIVGIAALLTSQALAVYLLWRLRHRPAAVLAGTVPFSATGAFLLVATTCIWTWFPPESPPPGEYRCGEIYLAIWGFIVFGSFVQFVLASVSVAAFVFARHRLKGAPA